MCKVVMTGDHRRGDAERMGQSNQNCGRARARPLGRSSPHSGLSRRAKDDDHRHMIWSRQRLVENAYRQARTAEGSGCAADGTASAVEPAGAPIGASAVALSA